MDNKDVMKIKKTNILIAAAVLTALLVALFSAAFFARINFPNIQVSDIQRLDLSTAKEINITNDGETVTLHTGQEEFDSIISVFNSKKVKTEDDRVHFWNEESYKLDFTTDTQKYILYGSPEVVHNEEKYLENPVVFVLYDYTNKDTMEYLYQTVSISKSEFSAVFPKAEEILLNTY